MGTTALADAKSCLSLAIAHNMDSVEPLTTEILAGYMGMPKKVAGTGGGADSFLDSSGSKAISYNSTNNTITYYYQRGDVKLKGEIDLTTQQMKWTSTLSDLKRAKALAQGLKIAAPAAGTGQNANVASGAATVGQLGVGAADALKFPGSK